MLCVKCSKELAHLLLVLCFLMSWMHWRQRDLEDQSLEHLNVWSINCLDGLEQRQDVFVIAATNRPDIIDPAMLRPGRLEKLLYVALPNATDRARILRTIIKERPKIDKDVDLAVIAANPKCEGFSGADLSALVREAAMACLKETFDGNEVEMNVEQLVVHARHFYQAFDHVAPSVSARDAKRYANLEKHLKSRILASKRDQEQN